MRAKACSYMIGIEGQKVSQKQIDEFVSLIRGRMPIRVSLRLRSLILSGIEWRSCLEKCVLDQG